MAIDSQRLDTLAREGQSEAKGDFRCVTCGYGAMSAAPPVRCPMCSGTNWEPFVWLPAAQQ